MVLQQVLFSNNNKKTGPPNLTKYPFLGKKFFLPQKLSLLFHCEIFNDRENKY